MTATKGFKCHGCLKRLDPDRPQLESKRQEYERETGLGQTTMKRLKLPNLLVLFCNSSAVLEARPVF